MFAGNNNFAMNKEEQNNENEMKENRTTTKRKPKDTKSIQAEQKKGDESFPWRFRLGVVRKAVSEGVRRARLSLATCRAISTGLRP